MIDKQILEGAKILIVDDINDNIKLLGRLIRNYKSKISVATNGKQAVEIASEIIPDLILMDVNMPEMNGFEAAEIITQNETTKHIPIIFLTALSDINDVIEGFNKGGLDYVTKPFNSTVLISRVKTHLSLKFQKDELKKLNDEIKKSDNQKTQFLSIVSHDLRSPMSGLVGLAKMINKDFDEFEKEELKELTVSMQEALENQYQFMENMLKWGNLQFDKVPVSMTDINLNFLIDQIFEVLKLNSNDKKVELNKQFEVETVFGDYNLIYSIFHNLIVNAIKYTKENGQVLVTAKEEDNFYKLSVKDNGIGMPKKVADSLFQVNKVQSRPGTNNEQGTGLGLIVSYESVLKHNGKIWAETEENVGTEFIFTLEKEN
ncbi:hybrid sensor histidine kinase/response regulator [Candidatus Kapabacteria bacterium]|nr:hybrid sensor histidine kinase/response regulator [Candidatus Kapabacteria bacterium]